MIDLSGRVALVTGASRGIGRAIAMKLAARGAIVVAAARAENAARTVGEITAAGGKAETASVDVSDAASGDALVAGALERHGIAHDQLLLRMRRDEWDAVIATNLTSVFTLTQAVLKPMIRQRTGRVICISSVVGQAGNAGQANYAASKAGIIGFAKAVAQEVASRNVTVNVVAPGLIETDMTRLITENARDQWASKIPLRRLGTPDDVASAVCFLASDEAAYITGQVLAVNGGMYM